MFLLRIALFVVISFVDDLSGGVLTRLLLLNQCRVILMASKVLLNDLEFLSL
jgi:hypothetical protein